MFGVSPIDFDINISNPKNCGWYFDLRNCLYSGPPHNRRGETANLSKVNNEIIVVMDMDKGTLKFIINNEDKVASYDNIPLNKILSPVVFLFDPNDSVEIISC